MNRVTFDVAVVGGGPAGGATALSLRSHAPSLSVVLIEASHYEAPRIGEALPPPGRQMLERLGVWESFRAQRHRAVQGTTAIWGSDAALDNDFIFMAAGNGWHLDRAAFDRMLAKEAENRGATLLLDTRFRAADRQGETEWRLTLSTGTSLSARFIVDATGAGAVVRYLGARFVSADRLVGFARFFEQDGGDPRTLVEAFESGWWYTAGLPDGRRIVACMTDVDLVQEMRLGEKEEWHRMLSATTRIREIVSCSKPIGPIVVRSAASRRLELAAGDRWLAVGDCASRFDPLSSQGIIKALRSGIFASYAIGDLLIKEDDSGLRRYGRYVLDEFENYINVRANYYREEKRWPASEFWRRRHASNTDSRPLEPALPQRAQRVSIGSFAVTVDDGADVLALQRGDDSLRMAAVDNLK